MTTSLEQSDRVVRIARLMIRVASRWHVETFFSGLKRSMLSTLASRRANTLIAEAAIKVLAYTNPR